MDFSPNRIPLDLMLAYHHWPHSTCQHILGRIPLRSDPCVSIDPYPVPSALCRLQLQLSIDQLTQLVYASMSWPYPANSFGSWIVCEYACIYIYIYIMHNPFSEKEIPNFQLPKVLHWYLHGLGPPPSAIMSVQAASSYCWVFNLPPSAGPITLLSP